jgi:magnesium chelatase family protein
MDLIIEVPAVSAADLLLPAPAEGSAEVAARVAAARRIQAERYAALGLGISCNAHCPPAVLEEVIDLDPAGQALMRNAAETLRLSARGFHRVLKVARTLADLDGEARPGRAHLAEALTYRGPSDRLRSAA